MAGGWSQRSPCMAPTETPAAFLRIAHRDLRAARSMADPSVFEEDSWGIYIQQATEKAHNLRLLFQMLRDQGAVFEPFMALSRFTLFAVLRRYDEEPDQEQLDRAAWNHLCAELLDHVASLLP